MPETPAVVVRENHIQCLDAALDQLIHKYLVLGYSDAECIRRVIADVWKENYISVKADIANSEEQQS